MEEVGIIRSLMNKEFHYEHKGDRCPDKLFSNDLQKVKKCIDEMMQQYKRDLAPEEVSAYFMAHNPSLTTAQKQSFSGLFHKIQSRRPMGNDVAQNVLSRLFQQYVGSEVASLGFDYVNGDIESLEPLREILAQYNDDFLPDLNIEWEDIDIQSLIDSHDMESRWVFNIPTLAQYVPGVNSGQLIEVGARPNTGKTSFHASMIAGPNGFAQQGAKCIILCNEEKAKRVATRYLTVATGMTMEEVRRDKARADAMYAPVKDNILIYDSSGKNMAWVESVCKTYRPDILVLDMGDKFATLHGYTRQDEALKANAIYAREIGKQYNCAVFYMSQLSAEAEGKTVLNQSMMEGSKTGKAAEADLMLLIAANPLVEGQKVQDAQRHLNVVKNKLTGWHGRLHCNLEHMYGRYVV
jgi:hypothetical protein